MRGMVEQQQEVMPHSSRFYPELRFLFMRVDHVLLMSLWASYRFSHKNRLVWHIVIDWHPIQGVFRVLDFLFITFTFFKHD